MKAKELLLLLSAVAFCGNQACADPVIAKVPFSQADKIEKAGASNKQGICWAYSLAWLDIMAIPEQRTFSPAAIQSRMNLFGQTEYVNGVDTRHTDYKKNLGEYQRRLGLIKLKKDEDAGLLTQYFVVEKNEPLTGSAKRGINKTASGFTKGGTSSKLPAFNHACAKLLEVMATPGARGVMIGIDFKDNSGHEIAAFSIAKSDSESKKSHVVAASLFDPNLGEWGCRGSGDGFDLFTISAWLGGVVRTLGKEPRDVVHVDWVVLEY